MLRAVGEFLFATICISMFLTFLSEAICWLRGVC